MELLDGKGFRPRYTAVFAVIFDSPSDGDARTAVKSHLDEIVEVLQVEGAGEPRELILMGLFGDGSLLPAQMHLDINKRGEIDLGS